MKALGGGLTDSVTDLVIQSSLVNMHMLSNTIQS